jgi:hypothetical protein
MAPPAATDFAVTAALPFITLMAALMLIAQPFAVRLPPPLPSIPTPVFASATMQAALLVLWPPSWANEAAATS